MLHGLLYIYTRFMDRGHVEVQLWSVPVYCARFITRCMNIVRSVRVSVSVSVSSLGLHVTHVPTHRPSWAGVFHVHHVVIGSMPALRRVHITHDHFTPIYRVRAEWWSQGCGWLWLLLVDGLAGEGDIDNAWVFIDVLHPPPPPPSPPDPGHPHMLQWVS